VLALSVQSIEGDHGVVEVLVVDLFHQRLDSGM
jgi:hypothetical protein